MSKQEWFELFDAFSAEFPIDPMVVKRNFGKDATRYLAWWMARKVREMREEGGRS